MSPEITPIGLGLLAALFAIEVGALWDLLPGEKMRETGMTSLACHKSLQALAKIVGSYFFC